MLLFFLVASCRSSCNSKSKYVWLWFWWIWDFNKWLKKKSSSLSEDWAAVLRPRCGSGCGHRLYSVARFSTLVWTRLSCPAVTDGSYISQSYLRYAVCVCKHGLESVVHADVVQEAHADLSLGLVNCNTNRGGGGNVSGWMNGCAVKLFQCPRWVLEVN